MIGRLLVLTVFLPAIPCLVNDDACFEVSTFEKAGECFRNVFQLYDTEGASINKKLINLEKRVQAHGTQLKRQSDELATLKLEVSSGELKGKKGDAGLPGIFGLPGMKGDKGNAAPIPWYDLTYAKGLKGDKGEQGYLGLPGRSGLVGIRGSLGIPGPKGKCDCHAGKSP